ncbi:MAG TPA: DUF2282 domain-containing protein [Burkholderiales bacterium]|nr:DUF2282 domain-containing protein [Burkholderiales bacterium]
MNKNILYSAITGILTAGTLIAASAKAAEALVVCKEQERCYGVSKASKNDCSTSSSVCAGTAKQDYQKDAWVYLPKGSCEKLAGGSLAAPGAAKKK